MKPKAAKQTKKAAKSKPRASGEPGRIEPIHAIYLYYFPPSGGVRIYEWWDPYDPIEEPEAEIKRIAKNAVNDGNDPPYYTDDPNRMMMRRRSYLAFAVSADDYTTGTHAEINFERQYGPINEPTDGHHTFQNAVSTAFATGGAQPGRLLVVYCENLMMSPRGKLEPKESETYKIGLPFFPLRGRRLSTAPDTGGTNMGPPVPPPARILAKRRR